MSLTENDKLINDRINFRSDKWLRIAIEVVVLLLAAASPWALGGYEAVSRFYILIGVALLLGLWAVRLVLVRAWANRGYGPAFCLAGLSLLSVFQMTPLPASVLSILSPGSAEVYSFYLPPERELLPGETAKPNNSNHPISISPSDTRNYFNDAVVLCILYCIVINNAVSVDAFRRFAWVCTINGVLASLLAFAQRLSSSEHVLYWSIVVGGTGYGPFEYRNVFPFFANVCIGLGIGLLASSAQKKRSFLQSAEGIWLFAFVAFMCTAVVFSYSRGGLLSLLVALLFGLILWVRKGRDRSTAGILFWLIPVVLAAGSWIGWTALEKRFENLAQDKSIAEDRFYVWRDSVRHFPEFPLFGTGNGTFEIAELITRRNLGEETVLYPNAHNEYVEALVEGGLVRLALTILFVVIVTAAGMRNFRRHAGRTLGWLVLGGLIGFWAVALHSMFDFGIHYPAIAMLATILAAHIVSSRQSESSGEVTKVPFVASLLMAGFMLILGALLVREGYLADQATRYRNAAVLEARTNATDAPRRRVAFLEAAVRIQPDNFRYCNELSLAYFALSRLESDPSNADRDIVESLRYARQARDLSPAYVRPHVWLGAFRNHLDRAQSPQWYFERALRSAPTDPTIWYAAGKERFEAGDFTSAWRDWRRSLEIDMRHFDSIVADAKKQLSWAEFMSQVLPDDPKTIFLAAERLYPDVAMPQRVPFLQKALDSLDKMGAKRNASDDLLRGKILHELKRNDDCIAALKLGIAKDRTNLDLRWELAQVYYEQEMFLEAQKEVRFILGRRPTDERARELLDVLERELILSQ